MIVLELLSGTRTEEEYQELSEDLEALQQFPITDTVWKFSGWLAHTLRHKGLSIPPTDILIASVALTYPCSLLHADKHFDMLARHVRLAVWEPHR
jgi:predicted nucleic acid-binding protein